MNLRMGKKIHLCEYETDELAEALNEMFERKVAIPRLRHGFNQTLDTLICEEATLFAKYLKDNGKEWVPRLPAVS